MNVEAHVIDKKHPVITQSVKILTCTMQTKWVIFEQFRSRWDATGAIKTVDVLITMQKYQWKYEISLK